MGNKKRFTKKSGKIKTKFGNKSKMCTNIELGLIVVP